MRKFFFFLLFFGANFTCECAQLCPSSRPDCLITPEVGSYVAGGFNAHLTLEFLYWTAREDNLAFAKKESFQLCPDGQTSITGKAKTYHPNWNYEPGFKIGIGYLYDHDGWGFYGNYTWLRVDDTKRKVALDESEMTTTQLKLIGFESFNDFAAISSISGRWSFAFDVVDLALGRGFYISRYLSLHPFLGLKGTWQDQCFTISTQGVGQNEAPLFARDDNTIDSWGIGMRAGLDTTWHFNSCVSFFGEMAISGLWQRLNVDRKISFDFSELDEFAEAKLHFDNPHTTLKPVLELFIGLRFETWYCCDSYHFSLDTGWEEQLWIGQNQFFVTENETPGGSLLLQGLTLKARLDF